MNEPRRYQAYTIRQLDLMPNLGMSYSFIDGLVGDLSGYFFGNFRDKASNIIWRYSAPYRPVIDCKMNDLE